MRFSGAILFTMALGACTPAGAPALSTHFSPGEWELTSILGDPSNPMRVTVCVDHRRAAQEPRDFVLSMISRTQCEAGDAEIADGRIDGALTCPGMDDIGEHRETLRGSYERDNFSTTVGMRVYGTTISQRIRGVHKGDCQS